MTVVKKVIYLLTDELLATEAITKVQHDKIIERVSKGKYLRGTVNDIKEILASSSPK